MPNVIQFQVLDDERATATASHVLAVSADAVLGIEAPVAGSETPHLLLHAGARIPLAESWEHAVEKWETALEEPLDFGSMEDDEDAEDDDEAGAKSEPWTIFDDAGSARIGIDGRIQTVRLGDVEIVVHEDGVSLMRGSSHLIPVPRHEVTRLGRVLHGIGLDYAELDEDEDDEGSGSCRSN
jgi:hypothetical protein